MGKLSGQLELLNAIKLPTFAWLHQPQGFEYALTCGQRFWDAWSPQVIAALQKAAENGYYVHNR